MRPRHLIAKQWKLRSDIRKDRRKACGLFHAKTPPKGALTITFLKERSVLEEEFLVVLPAVQLLLPFGLFLSRWLLRNRDKVHLQECFRQTFL